MIKDIFDAGSFTATHKNFTQFEFDYSGNVERDNLRMSSLQDADGSMDTLEHLLGDPFDYMYDIVWESNF